jgi:regulator of sirC expression with transglutaminase-like and TPR domain
VRAPAAELTTLLQADPVDLARAALVVATIECSDLDPRPSLARIEDLGVRAHAQMAPLASRPARERVAVLNRLVYEAEGYRGNHRHYDDFRNGLLHLVLERRLGLPITLAVLYMTVARRAGVDVAGVCFPGHFLMRVPLDERDLAERPGAAPDALILDPFDGGRELDEAACRALLARQTDRAGTFGPELLRACPPRQIVQRLLANLKRTYISMRSFPQAWLAAELLLVLDPTLDADLRDRGLLAYHLESYPQALRDLEDYLRRSDTAHEDVEERERIWDHVTGLRRRLAGRN